MSIFEVKRIRAPGLNGERWDSRSIRDAQREETRLIRECERELSEQEALGSQWGSVVESFERYLSTPQGQALHFTTRLDYVATVRKHTQVWWERPAGDISKADVRELLIQLRAKGLSASHQ